MGKHKTKKETFDEWMEGDHILVHLDSRLDEVIVPTHLKNNAALTLKLSYLFQGHTEADDTSIKSFLKFNGHYFECILPWSAIYAITNENSEQRIWPDSIPKDLIPPEHANNQDKEQPKAINNTSPPKPSSRSKPSLQRIK